MILSPFSTYLAHTLHVGCERLRREHRLSDQGSMLDLILHESKIIQDQ